MAPLSLRILATTPKVSRARSPPLFIAGPSLIGLTMLLVQAEREHFPGKLPRSLTLAHLALLYRVLSLEENVRWVVYFTPEPIFRKNTGTNCFSEIMVMGGFEPLS